MRPANEPSDSPRLGRSTALTLAYTCPIAGDASISTLNISANNIGDQGAAALAEMLKSNTTLERLDISSNVIDYDGITAISAALVDNTSLKALYVRCASEFCCALQAAVTCTGREPTFDR